VAYEDSSPVHVVMVATTYRFVFRRRFSLSLIEETLSCRISERQKVVDRRRLPGRDPGKAE